MTIGAGSSSSKKEPVTPDQGSQPEPGSDLDDPGHMPSTQAVLPESVMELQRLIARFPFKIEYSVSRMQVIENETWAKNNWATSKRISQLVFFDPDVQGFLSAHPDDVISRDNFANGILTARRQEVTV
jgi:hypothetical protein